MVRILTLLGALVFSTAAFTQTFTLPDCMNSHYGAGSWSQRTAAHQGSDIGPALDLCLTQIRSTWGRGKIVITPGIWRYVTPVAREKLSGIYIEGYGSQASLVIFDNDCKPFGASPFWWSGDGGYTGGGMRGVGLLLEQGLGQTNCYGIMLRGNSQSQPDQVEFSDIYMTTLGGSWWWDNLHVDGSARLAPLQGIRVAMLENLQLFSARNYTAYFANAVAMVLTNIGCWSAIGPVPNSLVIDSASVEMSLRAVWCNIFDYSAPTGTTRFLQKSPLFTGGG